MKAPRLLTRALVTSFVTVAIVLGAVFVVLSLRARDQVRQAVADNLASAQQVSTRVEARRQRAAAFNAMTSARGYRSGRLPVEAVAELRRCIGTDFDGPAVEALVAPLPRLVSAVDPVSGSRMEKHWDRSGGAASGSLVERSGSCEQWR